MRRILVLSFAALLGAGCSSDEKQPDPAPEGQAEARVEYAESYAGIWKQSDGASFKVVDGDDGSVVGTLDADPLDRWESLEFTLNREDQGFVGTCRFVTTEASIPGEVRWELTPTQQGDAEGRTQAAFIDNGELITFDLNPMWEARSFEIDRSADTDEPAVLADAGDTDSTDDSGDDMAATDDDDSGDDMADAGTDDDSGDDYGDDDDSGDDMADAGTDDDSGDGDDDDSGDDMADAGTDDDSGDDDPTDSEYDYTDDHSGGTSGDDMADAGTDDSSDSSDPWADSTGGSSGTPAVAVDPADDDSGDDMADAGTDDSGDDYGDDDTTDDSGDDMAEAGTDDSGDDSGDDTSDDSTDDMADAGTDDDSGASDDPWADSTGGGSSSSDSGDDSGDDMADAGTDDSGDDSGDDYGDDDSGDDSGDDDTTDDSGDDMADAGTDDSGGDDYGDDDTGDDYGDDPEDDPFALDPEDVDAEVDESSRELADAQRKAELEETERLAKIRELRKTPKGLCEQLFKALKEEDGVLYTACWINREDAGFLAKEEASSLITRATTARTTLWRQTTSGQLGKLASFTSLDGDPEASRIRGYDEVLDGTAVIAVQGGESVELKIVRLAQVKDRSWKIVKISR